MMTFPLLVCVFILLYFALEKKITSSLSLVLMSLVTIVIVLQNSGTGYIVYMGLIYAIFHRINFFKIKIKTTTHLLPLKIISFFYPLTQPETQKSHYINFDC